MMPIEPVTLSFSAALLLGLSFGAGPCNIACLPYLGPVFMANGGGIRGSWRTLLPFSLGRLSGYSLLGTAAGWAGVLVQDWLNAPWVHWVLGAATVLVALSILWRTRRQGKVCGHSDTVTGTGINVPLQERNPPSLPGGLFFMGMGMALNPCAPLTTIILAAATTASAVAGLSLGLGFGLGAVFIPTLFFAVGVAHFGSQVREHLIQWRGGLEKISVGLLLLLGTSTAMGWIVP